MAPASRTDGDRVDTIAALGTPLGEAALGVIRLSGPASIEIAASFFSSAAPLTKASTHTLHLGWIKKDNRPLDQTLAAVFRAPNSYTGENMVELSCHGSPVVLKEVLSLCVAAGARLAEPGEFTQRAYLNGKMDLAQAEAVAQLIASGSASARSAALVQLDGTLSGRLRTLRETLLNTLAHVEANLDFVEEDIPGVAREKMTADITSVRKEIEELLATSLRGRILREGLRVAIVGRPNVGKSSLFNALLSQDRAIVTDVPGTTRDVLEEKLEWEGIGVVLSDTAGLRETIDPVEREGTRRSAQAMDRADVVLLVVDATVPFSDDDRKAASLAGGKPLIIAHNKIDVVRARHAVPLHGANIIETSALKSTGLNALKAAVVAAATPAPTGTATLTNTRHVGHLDKALAHLLAAETALKNKRSEETFSVDLRKALEELGRITGEAVTEDMLTAIFRQFCIGK